jgi:hypothetical protein
MKKMTAVMALVMVLGVAVMTATPASAATPQFSSPRPAAAAIGLLERVMQLLGLRTSPTPTSTTGVTQGTQTVSTDEAIWGGPGRCQIPGTCR